MRSQQRMDGMDARKLADEELSRLLVTPDLTESDRSRSVPMGLLDTTSGGGRLPGGLGCELLAGGLSSSRLSRGLLQGQVSVRGRGHARL